MERQKYIKLDNGAYLRLSTDRNGNPRKFIEFKTQHARQYAAYILIKKDLDLVLTALSQLKLNSQGQIVNQSLSFFAIITYSKCFLSNNGRGTSLNVNLIFKDAPQNLIAIHERISNLRNDHVAHAGSGFEKCAVTGTIDMEIGGMHLEGNLAYVTDIKADLETFNDLCAYVMNHVEKKIRLFQNKIFEYFQSLTFEEIMMLSKIPDIKKLYIMEPDADELNPESYVIKPYIAI